MSYNQYPKYKDSGIECIGEIPEDWKVSKIKHTSYVKGRIGWQGLTTNEYLEGGDYYLITGTDFLNGRIDWENCHFVEKDRYEQDPYIQISNNDILITKDGTIGKIAIIDKMEKQATLNSGIFVVRPLNSEYIAKFLYWILNSNIFNTFIEIITSGTTINHLYQNIFVDFQFPLINVLEQKAIANYLDRKTRQIDTLIEKKQNQIELLKEQRAAVINQAVTKGLDPNVKMKDSGIEWIGEIPEGWEVKKLKLFSKIVLGKMLTPHDKGNYIKKPYLRAKNILWEKVDANDIKEMWFSSQELSQYRLKENDLIVSEGGEVGRTAVWRNELDECYIQNSVHKVTIKEEYNYKYFLYHFLNYGNKGNFDSIVNRVSIAHLTKEKLQDVYFLVPPPNDQKYISAFLDNQASQIDNLIIKIQNHISLLQEYRTTLISEVVTGKIDVREY